MSTPSWMTPEVVQFTNDFLAPIAADGRLDAHEETPLIFAYRAYRIDEMFNVYREELSNWFKEAIRKALTDPTPKSHDLARAWERLEKVLDGMEIGLITNVRGWFEREAKARGLAWRPPQFKGKPGTGKTARHAVYLFEQLLKDVKSEAPLTSPSFDSVKSSSIRPGLETKPFIYPSFKTTTKPASPLVEPPPVSYDKREAIPSGLPAASVSRSPTEIRAPDVLPPALPPTVSIVSLEVDAAQAQIASADAVSARSDPSFVADLLRQTVKSIDVLRRHGRKLNFAFDEYRKDSEKFVIVNKLSIADDIWFIGDIHGDLLALNLLLNHIDSAAKRDGKSPTLVLLGDLFDDGDLGHLVVLRVLNLMLERPGKVCLIAGNHDEALSYVAETDVFTSNVSPAEFSEWLNARPGDSPWRELGRVIIDLIADTPRALLFPDGLLAAHGGVPHSDLQAKLAHAAQLNDPAYLQDFVWTRAHESVKRRIPNRASKGCSFGYEDFQGFCSKTSELLGKPVKRMIRGHDHMEDRFKLYEKYALNPMLTINAMSYRQRDITGPYVRIPCAARYVSGELPEVHRLRIPEAAVQATYPQQVMEPGGDSNG